MIEENKKFLSKDVCKYCIDTINKNFDKTQIHSKRHVLKLKNINDLKIEKLLKKYQLLFKNYYIKNIEIVFWPIGELHDWHIDNGYEDEQFNYDITTITYLNKNYEGGRTIVEDKTIEPEIGKIVKFFSGKKHMVTKLLKGKRYVIVAWYNKL